MLEEKPILRLLLTWMYNKELFITLFFLLPLCAFAQECNKTVKGSVLDFSSSEPLPYVNVYIKETQGGVKSDSNGNFVLKNICPGDYHIVFSHIGCDSRQVFIQFKNDTTLTISLEHNHNVLHSVKIQDKNGRSTTQNIEQLNKQQIGDKANDNLSNMLEELTGVSTMRNGSGIAKPVVHGLYGNRITILNNGVAQSGQQWGNDHSPEIDPMVAKRIRVLKGVSSLQYPGSNLGSVVLIEPDKINNEPHLHGTASYFFETNGRGHGTNISLEQFNPKLAWRVNGTLKKNGDRRTPAYFLNNTGANERNLSIQLEKSFKNKLFTDLYFSTFNTTLGVLRGSHIGNVNDLKSSFNRSVPFYTEDKFSYGIDAPKQNVNHHLFKLHAKYYKNENHFWDVTLAQQLNNRKEFDVRRSGRSDIPAMSLLQHTFFAEAKQTLILKNDWKLINGLQFTFTDNMNNPETGILPLIPDYRSYESGLYSLINKRVKKSFFEFGVRYDNVFQDVTAISSDLPRRLLFYENWFHNISANAGWTYSIDDHKQLSYNVGYATRNPAINELYSNGLHQGVSGLEYGDTSLNKENALKTTLSLNLDFDHHSAIEALVYYQYINDYIFLEPQSEFSTSIRGTFPVFNYRQTNAQIYGFDLSTNYELLENLTAKGTFSYIRGKDLTNDAPLVFIPANNFTLGLKYVYPKSIQLGKKVAENLEIGLEDRYTFRQTNLNDDQDFVPPPAAYNLLSAKLAVDVQLRKNRLRLFMRGTNLLNAEYRDYLNRQRYFANDMGRNIVIGARLKF